MKVKDLSIGMWLEPANNWKWTLAGKTNKYLCIFRGTYKLKSSPPSKYAIYLGQRKDLNITKRSDWSNRYCLFEGEILPVNQSDWPYIQPAKSK